MKRTTAQSDQWNQDQDVRRVMSDAILRSGKSRTQIATELSAAVGHSVTPYAINDWTSPSKETHRFPLAWTAAFCRVTGDSRLISVVAELLDLYLIPQENLSLITLGETAVALEEKRREFERQIEVQLERKGQL